VHDAIQDFAYFLRSNSPRKAAIAFYVVISGQWDYPKPQRFPSNNLFGGKQREAHQRQALPAWTARWQPRKFTVPQVGPCPPLYAQKICASV
jgi:hypothetical protein